MLEVPAPWCGEPGISSWTERQIRVQPVWLMVATEYAQQDPEVSQTLRGFSVPGMIAG